MVEVPDQGVGQAGSGKISLPGMQMVTFSLRPVLTWQRERALVSLLARTLILLNQGPTLMTSSNRDYLLTAPSPASPSRIALAGRASAYGFQGNTVQSHLG